MSNYATATSPLDQLPSGIVYPLFGIVPHLALGLGTGRFWVALCPFVFLLALTAIVAASWDDSSGEGAIGLAVLWAFSVPAAALILVGAAIGRAVRRHR